MVEHVRLDLHVHVDGPLSFELPGWREALSRIHHQLQVGNQKMAEIDDKLAAQTAAVSDLADAVSSVEADLRHEHQQLMDALAQIANASSVTPETIAAIQASTDAIGGMAAKLRTAVEETPDPEAAPPAEPPTP